MEFISTISKISKITKGLDLTERIRLSHRGNMRFKFQLRKVFIFFFKKKVFIFRKVKVTSDGGIYKKIKKK